MSNRTVRFVQEEKDVKYIPLAALCTGTIISMLINVRGGIDAQVILGGMISGLASTGLYEMLRNLLNLNGHSGVPDFSFSLCLPAF